MTFDEKLTAILQASPPPVPWIPKWNANAAPQGSVPPYGVFQLISSPQILSHDDKYEVNPTSVWRYQITIVDSSYLRGRQGMKLLRQFLPLYTDSPRPGIMRFLPLGERSGYLQTERFHQFFQDWDIMENIP